MQSGQGVWGGSISVHKPLALRTPKFVQKIVRKCLNITLHTCA